MFSNLICYTYLLLLIMTLLCFLLVLSTWLWRTVFLGLVRVDWWLRRRTWGSDTFWSASSWITDNGVVVINGFAFKLNGVGRGAWGWIHAKTNCNWGLGSTEDVYRFIFWIMITRFCSKQRRDKDKTCNKKETVLVLIVSSCNSFGMEE